MWTRKELKTKGKTSFKNNYWKTVLIAMLAMAISGGGAASAAGSNGPRATINASGEATQQEADRYDDELSPEELEEIDGLLEQIESTPDPDATYDGSESLDEIIPEVVLNPQGNHDSGIPVAAVGMFLVITTVVVLVIVAIALVISAFVINPLSAGTARFFTRNLNQPAEVKEVTYAFDHNYREVVRTMFWRDIYTLLWGLLLIIPGIVKAYEYRMIPFLLAEDPTMTKDEAFAQSKAMMTGNKWRAFVLDLSFLGWMLLSVLTLGVLAIFYVAPYECMTDAALYEKLRYGGNAPAGNAPELPTVAGPDAQIPIPTYAAADAPVPVWDEDSRTTEDDLAANGPAHLDYPEE